MVRLAAIQSPACSMDLARNAEQAVALVSAAASAGATLVGLPELATVPYFCGDRDPAPYRHWAEPAHGALAARFSALARELAVTVLLPLYEHDQASGCYHNAVLAFGPDGALLRPAPIARKLHLPIGEAPPPGFDESVHFTPGAGLTVVEAGGLRLGTLVCYDRRFPEAWRALRRMGADIVFVPVAGSGGDDMDFFVGEMRTHARENGLAVLCANKVGDEHVGGAVVDNYGWSCIIAADGTVLASRPRESGAGLIVADIDPDSIQATRRALRYFDHRRTDLWPDPISETPT
jgi:N-carbamoylputrescine amidase